MDASRVGPQSRRRTRVALVATVISLVATLALVAGSPSPAEADTVNSSVLASCTAPLGSQNLNVPVEAIDTPDPVAAGDTMVISYTAGTVSAYPVSRARWVWPVPPEVDVFDVTYSNLGTFTTDPFNPVLFGTGLPVTVTLIGGSAFGPVPTIEIHVVVKPSASGQTIDWPAFTSTRTVSTGVPFFGTVDTTCTPYPSQTVNSTTVL